MHMIEEDAERALDTILQPYGESGAWYLDKLPIEGPPPWAFVALRSEYDIADYIVAQRDKLGAAQTMKFTFYDQRQIEADNFTPKVACLIFLSKSTAAAAAKQIPFLQPAWALLRDMPEEKCWLVLLDEDPASVLREALTAR
jgi:hypothetical protein